MQVYAPTSEAPVDEIDSFYNFLQMIIDEQDNNAFLVIMGDFNAKWVYSIYTYIYIFI